MKTLLQLTGIHKSYGVQVVLDEATVTVSDEQKIGVIGRNGAGKSTLCKIIVGDEEQDAGSIQKSTYLRLAYLEQHDPYKLDETVISFLARYTGKEEWRCGKVASRFQLKNDILSATIGSLPGGFRTRVKLTAMLLKDPNLLILDEPTNYLDLKTLILLEEFLADYRGAFLIVSHDREFLKRTCKETLEIENGSCVLYPGTVEEYLLFKEEQERLIESHNKNILAKRKQLQAFIDRFGAKATKASQAKSMAKKMEHLKTIDTGHALHNVRLKIPRIEKRNLPAFSCNDLTIGYPGHRVAGNITMDFNQGDHVAVLGDNGQGKTTFMRTIAGDLEVLGGKFKWGHALTVGYYAQHVLSILDPEKDVYSYLVGKADASVMRQDILNLAGSFLFKGDDVLKKIGVLSGGEKARLCLAGLLLSKVDVLLLDEPTNHLDFETVEALGEALHTCNATVFFISHDRTFVNMLASRIVEVNNGAVVRYPGTYEEYVYSMEARVRDETGGDEAAVQPEQKRVHPPERTRERDRVKRLKAERIQLRSKIRQVQERLERHKGEYDEICRMFANDSASWTVESNARYERLGEEIRSGEDLWLELTEKEEELSKNVEEAER